MSSPPQVDVMLRNAMPRTAPGLIVSSPEFNDLDTVMNIVNSNVSLRTDALPFNPNLHESVWFKLYTVKPKISLIQALALTSRSLSKEQREFLLKYEKRAQVWAQVMRGNPLSPEEVTFLAKHKRLDSRIAVDTGYKVIENSRPSVLTLTKEAADNLTIRSLQRPNLRGPIVNYLKESFENDATKWETLISLSTNSSFSIKELADNVNNLN